MQDLLGMIAALNRPRLLVRAARFGVEDYDRDVHLPRLLKSSDAPRPGRAVIMLLAEEAAQETNRRSEGTGYTLARHVELLIALLGEARELRALRQDPPVPVAMAVS